MPCRRALAAAPLLPRLIVSLALALLGARLCAAPTPLPWQPGVRGVFVTALCQDHAGHVWVADEDQGLYRYDPDTGHSTHFTTKDGLGSDDVYALACDAKGRLWAGTLRGLAVFNGRRWQTYGPLQGVGGWRTFALAASPLDGDIWAATEAGLTRYSLAHDRWTQYSRADGLPSDALACLAFDKRGTLYVGT